MLDRSRGTKQCRKLQNLNPREVGAQISREEINEVTTAAALVFLLFPEKLLCASYRGITVGLRSLPSHTISKVCALVKGMRPRHIALFVGPPRTSVAQIRRTGLKMPSVSPLNAGPAHVAVDEAGRSRTTHHGVGPPRLLSRPL